MESISLLICSGSYRNNITVDIELYNFGNLIIQGASWEYWKLHETIPWVKTRNKGLIQVGLKFSLADTANFRCWVSRVFEAVNGLSRLKFIDIFCRKTHY